MSQSFKSPATGLFAAMWTAQSGQCALCGRAMLRNRFETVHARLWAKHRATIDHILPVSKGGTDDPGNLQLAHAQCNKVKGNRR
ncbi:MAG: HNH endonuclease [Pseudomonadota bacterium]